MATRVTLLTCCRSCSKFFLTAEKFWNHSSSCLWSWRRWWCKWSVWCRNRRFEWWEMTALVLKTLSDLECGNSRWNEVLHFSFEGETLFEKENNPCVSSLSQKFSFSVLLSSDGGKIFFSITCIIFRSRWWEQSRPEPYPFSFYQHFAVQND